jgi:DNA-directed RNA polymerase specialized sigma24 family protein
MTRTAAQLVSSISMLQQSLPPPSRRATQDWHWSQLRALALRQARRCLDADEAEDYAQEAILRAWRNAHNCNGPPGPRVQTIARNEALRKATRRAERPLADEWHNVGSHGWWGRAAPRRRERAYALSAGERQAVFLRYWGGKTDAEIAALTDTPLGTIKIRIHRALPKLTQQDGGLRR